MSKIIYARFIGSDSLGYKKGELYSLQIFPEGLKVSRRDGSGACEYESLPAFLNNWDTIQNIMYEPELKPVKRRSSTIPDYSALH